MDLKVDMLTAVDTPTTIEKEEIASFLYEHLQEYGDPKEDIMRCLDYALSNFAHQGGFVLIGRHDKKIVGVVVINKTGMSGYIPENILVYIATHNDFRGKGIGKLMMNEAIKRAQGDVALHVEPDNPAVHLYKKVGFTNKYLEMRYQKG